MHQHMKWLRRIGGMGALLLAATLMTFAHTAKAEEGAWLLVELWEIRAVVCPRTPNPSLCEEDFSAFARTYIAAYAERLRRYPPPSEPRCDYAACKKIHRELSALRQKYEKYEPPLTN